VTGIETDPAAFVRDLKVAMTALADEIDAGFPGNAHAEIADVCARA
jgi:hypothetical protein